MKRDAPGALRGRRSFFAAALLCALAACGDAASPAHPIVDEPSTTPTAPTPKEPPVHTGVGVSPQSVPAMDAAPTLPAHCSSPEIRRIPRPAAQWRQ